MKTKIGDRLEFYSVPASMPPIGERLRPYAVRTGVVIDLTVMERSDVIPIVWVEELETVG